MKSQDRKNIIFCKLLWKRKKIVLFCVLWLQFELLSSSVILLNFRSNLVENLENIIYVKFYKEGRVKWLCVKTSVR